MNASTVEKNTDKKWVVLEKIIGAILLIWSIVVLYSVLSVAAVISKYNPASAGKITFIKAIFNNHLILIISILCLFGSCMLLYKDKNGWMLCVVTSLMFAIILFISARMKTNNDVLPFAEYYKSYGAAALLLFVIFFLLLIKPIRKRYMPTTKTWLWMIGITVLLLIDKVIF